MQYLKFRYLILFFFLYFSLKKIKCQPLYHSFFFTFGLNLELIRWLRGVNKTFFFRVRPNAILNRTFSVLIQTFHIQSKTFPFFESVPLTFRISPSHFSKSVCLVFCARPLHFFELVLPILSIQNFLFFESDLSIFSSQSFPFFQVKLSHFIQKTFT